MNTKVKRILSIIIPIVALVVAGGIPLITNLLNNKEIYVAPTNIVYDGAYLTWDKCNNADYYNVAINSGDEIRVNATTYAYTTTDSFDVTVTAVYEDTSKSTSVTFNPLSKIETLDIADDGTISWDPVSGATAYSVSVNGKVSNVTEPIYQQLPAGSNRVKVKPIVTGDNSFYSWWSAESNIYIYNQPNTIKYDGAEVSWIGNALSYEVTINGQMQTVTGNSCDFNSENKDFVIEIKALGNHSGTYDSKVAHEEFHYLDTVTELKVEDGIIKWDEVPNAVGYKIKINDIVQNANLTVAQYNNLATGRTNEVAVMPYNNTGNYFSSWSASKNIYILDTPTIAWNADLELDGEANNNLTWNSVNAADGYTVRITKDGQSKTTTYSSGQLAFAEAYSEVGVYTVEVKTNAASDSNSYYDSKYSEPITVVRLAAPKATANNAVVSEPDNLAAGLTINYVPVNGASGYQLYKDGVLLSGKFTTGTSLSDNNVADNVNIQEQHYTYKVRSMGSVKTLSGAKYVTLPCLTKDALSFDITVQATPQNPMMSGYILSWDAINGNNNYSVSFAGTTVTAQGESWDLSTLKAGSYSINICARGNGSTVLASNYSSPVNIQRLSAPTEIKITSANNGTLQWKDVSNATGYQVFLDLSSTALTDNAYNNMYQYITTAGTTLSMIAVANKYNSNNTLYYMTSENSPTQQFIRLAAPTFAEGALANSIELSWQASANINTQEYTPTYNIYSAQGEQITGGTQNGTKYNIEHLVGGSDYKFLVKAIGNDTKYLDSDYSEEITVYKIATPTLRIENNQYVWNSVTNASSYYLSIDGKKVSDEFHQSGSEYSYIPRYTTAGTHIVKLQAIGDAQSNGHNVNSEEFTFNQIAQVLSTPTITYAYSDDTVVHNGTITVTLGEPVQHCTNYQYEIAGESIVTDELTYSKTILNTGKYAIRVMALGGTFDSNGIYYVDSQYAGGSAADAIILLGKPNVSTFAITSDGVIKWDKVDNNYGYDYQISYDNGDWSLVAHRSSATVEVGGDYKKYSSITVRVRTTGAANGKVITSEWIEWTWTNSDLLFR